MRFADNASIATDTMVNDDILAGTDVSTGNDRKFTLANLAAWILNKFTGLSLAGSNQTVKAALDSLNSNLLVYNTGITASTAADYIAEYVTHITIPSNLKTATFSGNWSNNGYVTGIIRKVSSNGFCGIFKVALNNASYSKEYSFWSWNGTDVYAEQMPTRTEMDALNGVKIITSSITANASKTFTVESNSRILAVVLTNQTAAIGAFGISVTSGGSVYRQKIGGGESIEISAVATNAVTFTHSATSGGGIVAFICFSGSVSET